MKTLINIRDNIRLNPPPKSPEKKDVNICKQIFDIKWPIKLAGITIRKYFESYPEFNKKCPMSNRVLCEECRKDTLDLLVF